MSYLGLNQIEKTVQELSKKIDAPQELLPTFGTSRDFGYPHIEVDGMGYHFVVVERGTEWERRSSRQLSDLLYWIFEGITFSMAGDFELKHRIAGQDPRKLIFETQIELLSKIDIDFANRVKKEIDDTLKDHPLTNL